MGRTLFVIFLAVTFPFFSGCKGDTNENPATPPENTENSAPENGEETPPEQADAPDKNTKEQTTVVAPGASEFEEEMRAIGKEVSDALATCRENGLPHLQGSASNIGLAKKITEGCAKLLGQKPKHAESVWGRSYTVDGMLASLARFEDELRIFQVTLASKAATDVISNMSEHVTEAAKAVEAHTNQVLEMNQGRAALDAISESTVISSRMKSEAIRYAQNDSNDIGKLLERFDLYAHQQGANSDLVRGASLQHYGVSNQRRLAHRKKWFSLTATKPANAGDQIKALSLAYIDISDGFLNGYLASVEAFRSGAIADQTAADANRAELAKLHDAWRAAQKKLIGDLEAL